MENLYFLINKNSEDIATLKAHDERVGETIQQIIDNQKSIENKVLDCSTYLIKTLQILERVVPALPPGTSAEAHSIAGDFSLTEAISALEKLRDQ